MALADPHAEVARPQALDSPAISLVGAVDTAMVEKLRDGLAGAPGEGDLAIEITSSGGDAELARRMVLEVEQHRRKRKGRLLFLGKTQVYSAAVTFMSAFPRADRYLSRDAMLLIHVRQLEQTVEVSGPMRASLPQLQSLCRQIEIGMGQEEEGFRSLIEGSDVGLDELLGKALYNWYLDAAEAEKRGLVAGIVE